MKIEGVDMISRRKLIFLLVTLVLAVVSYRFIVGETVKMKAHLQSVPTGNGDVTTVTVDCKTLAPIRQKQDIMNDKNRSGVMFYFDDPPVGNYKDIAISLKAIGNLHMLHSTNRDGRLAVLLEGTSPSRELIFELRPDSPKLISESGQLLRSAGGSGSDIEQGSQVVRLFDSPSKSEKVLDQMSVLLKYSTEPINRKYGPFELSFPDKPILLNDEGLAILAFDWVIANRPVDLVSFLPSSDVTPYDLRSPKSPDQSSYLVMQLYVKGNSGGKRPQHVIAHGSDGRQVLLVERFNQNILSFSSGVQERPPYLGFQVTPEAAVAAEGGMQTPRHYQVVNVDPHGPANKAGIKRGDVLRSIGGMRFDSHGIMDPVGFARPGQSLPVQIVRNGKEHNVTLVPDIDPLARGLNRTNDNITRSLEKHFANANASALESYILVSKAAVPSDFRPSHIDLYYAEAGSSKPHYSTMKVIFKNIPIPEELRR